MTSSRHSEKTRADVHAVAAAARVSVATVSRTLNGKTSVSPTLSKRVLRAVDELGYVRNAHATSLRSACSGFLGLIISEPLIPCFVDLIHHFEDAAFLQGYDLLIGTLNTTSRGADILVRHMIQRGVDGVAILTSTLEEHFIDQFLQHNIRLLLTPGRMKPHVNNVNLDIGYAAHLAVQHLAVLGHRNIAYVREHSENVFLEMPPGAFSIAMSKIGLEVPKHRIIESRPDRHDRFNTLQELLEQPPLPTAIVCSTDVVALKLLKAVLAEGLSVPGDMSVIGFGEIYLARHSTPPLTTVQMSKSDFAVHVINLLCVSESQRKTERAKLPRINWDVIVRQTTSFPRDSILNRKSNTDLFEN